MQSAEGLLEVLCEVSPPPTNKGRPTYKPVTALLLLNEFTYLLKAAQIENSRLMEALNGIYQSEKPFTICFLGAADLALPPNARAAATLKDAADLSLGRAAELPLASAPAVRATRGKAVRGLFAGGTFCAEAQIVFGQRGLAVASNVPVPGARPLRGATDGHVLIDLGDDEFTRGRPHPMIDPAVRDRPIVDALADRAVGVLLIDVVLGYGAHADPAGVLIAALKGAHKPAIASVTGTEHDPQRWSLQVAALRGAGVHVAPSNAYAAMLAAASVT